MRPVVIIANLSAGTGRARRAWIETVPALLEERGLPATLKVIDPGELKGCIETAVAGEPSLIVAAGGDGTVRSFATALAGSKHTLGVLPLGTMNHFARALGVPGNPEEALETLIEGVDVDVDAGDIAGEIFLTSVTVGLYPNLVAMRERRRRKHSHWPNLLRWLVDSLVAAKEVFTRWRPVSYRLEANGENAAGSTINLLILPETRKRLPDLEDDADGQLNIYLPKPLTRGRFLRLAFKAVFTQPDALEPLDIRHVSHARLDVPVGTRMALDGEVRRVKGPMELRAVKRYCRVRVPGAFVPGASQ